MDGSLGFASNPQTFTLFARRLRELAYQASWRADGRYQPVESVDILLLGDILDPLQSVGWLQRDPQDTSYIRPWHDSRSSLFALTLQRITRQIFTANAHAGEIFRRLAAGEALRLPPVNGRGQPDFYSRERIAPRVRIHYMVGNHDWYYHLPGQAYDEIRREVIAFLGLTNYASPFPHDAAESGLLTGLFLEYGLTARHGDIFDPFNYNPQTGRDSAAMSDFFACEVVFRFPLELERRHALELPPAAREAAYRVTSVRPLLGSPLWLRQELQALTTSPRLERIIKRTWNEVVDRFLQMDEVRSQAKSLGLTKFRALQTLLSVSKTASFSTVSGISGWMSQHFGESGPSLASHARHEPDIRERRARFVVYGHTHQHEVIALDSPRVSPRESRQVYINTGAWGTFMDLRQKSRFNLLSCLALYHQDERGGRTFEPWWANFS